MAAEKSKGKRPLDVVDDYTEDTSTMEKKPRFPKGKKAKKEDFIVNNDEEDDVIGIDKDPVLAAKERAKRRYQMKEEDVLGVGGDVSAAEVVYDENAQFEDDGIELEPFNLKQEREDGYFDANGNYVEYVGRNETKDAWLDNVEVDPSLAEKVQNKSATEEEYKELSSEDIGKTKRSIANSLQPGETIIQALKRFKGESGDKKGKMSEGTQRLFDQLTEDAMKLMENGEYNVYHEEREIFEQEAEGYEKIALARKGIFATAIDTPSNSSSSIWDKPLNTADANPPLNMSTADDNDQFDIFGDDDDNANLHVQSNGIEQNPQSGEVGNETESDYFFDESSGYYYSSSLGYYYDPTSKLYCSATSGKWYSFDEQTGEYTEYINADATAGQS